MKYRILVIDDNKDDLYFFKRAIVNSGVNTQLTCHSEGLSALDVIQKNTFDFIFLDYYLVTIDGLTVLKQIRNAGIDIPVVMLTGEKNGAIIVKLMLAGATDYLSKDNLTSESLRITIENSYKLYLIKKEKSLAENALKESEARLLEAQYIAHLGNWSVDLINGQFDLSREAQRLLGKNNYGHFSLLYFSRKIYEKDFSDLKQSIKYLRENDSFNVTVHFYSENNDLRCLNIKGNLLSSTNLVGTVQDITELKRALLETQRAKIKSKATSIVLMIAITFFLISEAVLDPLIDSLTASLLISLSFKGSIAIVLKPVEMVLEKIMSSQFLLAKV